MNIQEVCKVVYILASIGLLSIFLLTVLDVIEYIKSYFDRKIRFKK